MTVSSHKVLSRELARSNAIKQRATELGFDTCGIAAAEPIDPEDRLGEWLSKGYHADMLWMETSKAVRQDVHLKLPNARSVVVVARNYYTSGSPPQTETEMGKVARYAWGRDYHRVLRKPLISLSSYIDSLDFEAASYSCIDSGPVMERTWAQRAGVGWIGKNALVIRRDLGSWFFLGVIISTVEMAADSPAMDYCGTCTLCLDACPTHAIVEPHAVDSRRCISYQTIENRAEIPSDIQNSMGGWIFGCDICQEVCPWNRKPTETTETAFHARGGQAFPELQPLVEMSDVAFRESYSGTPLMRAKYEGMKRNARVALSNAGRNEKDTLHES